MLLCLSKEHQRDAKCRFWLRESDPILRKLFIIHCQRILKWLLPASQQRSPDIGEASKKGIKLSLNEDKILPGKHPVPIVGNSPKFTVVESRIIAMLFLEFLKLKFGWIKTFEMLKSRAGKTSLTLKLRSPSRTVKSEKSLQARKVHLKAFELIPWKFTLVWKAYLLSLSNVGGQWVMQWVAVGLWSLIKPLRQMDKPPTVHDNLMRPKHFECQYNETRENSTWNIPRSHNWWIPKTTSISQRGTTHIQSTIARSLVLNN